MKKLLVLALVLGIASMATAGFELKKVDGSVQSSGTMEGYIYLILAADNGVTLSNYAIGDVPDAQFSQEAGPLGDFGGADNQGLFDAAIGAGQKGLGYTYAALSTAVYPFTGNFVSADWEGQGWVHLYTWDEGTGDATLEASVYVPEPATMALLGLGALVLRRKK